MYIPLPTVNIVLIPGDAVLQSQIAAQKHPVISQFNMLAMDAIPDGVTHTDIVIIGQQVGTAWAQTLRTRFPNALVIWRAAPAEMASLPPQGSWDDVWATTMQPQELAHRFFSLLDRHIRKSRSYFYDKALHAAINNLPYLVWFKNVERTHLKVNDAFCDCVGKEKSDVEGYDHWHIWGITREEYEKSEYVCVDTDDVIINNRKPDVFDETVKSVRGMRHFKAYKSPFYDEAGNLLGTVGVAQDVTDLRNIDIRFKVVLNSMPFATLFADEDGRTVHINPKFESMFGVRSEDLVGRKTKIEKLVQVISRKMIHDGREEEIQIITSEGQVAQVVIQQVPIFDIFNNAVAHLEIYIDVTRSREVDRRLKEMAYTDALTGLFTRHYLFYQLDRLSADNGIALLSMDLDNFKRVNDQYGHGAGDDLLKLVGETIKQVFPEEICVRLGGDEFLVVKTGKMLNIQEFVQNANMLRQRLLERFAKEDNFQMVNMSGGIAISYDMHSKDFDQLLEESDKALYESKKNGKGRVTVYDLEKDTVSVDMVKSPPPRYSPGSRLIFWSDCS